MKKIFTFCLALSGFLFSQAQTVYLTGVLSGQQETPPTSSAGTGVVIVKYDTVSRSLHLLGNYANLKDTITMSHIHRGAPGTAGPIRVFVGNTHDTTGTLDTTATISSTLADSLLSGNTYANVHTDSFPSGEIRGQLTLSNPKTAFFAVNLSAAQEVPPITNSSATGTAWVLIDRTAGILYVTGSFAGINSAVSKADVRRGATGDTGTVILSLTPSYVTSKKTGTFSGTAALPASTLDSLINGLAYINIYSARLATGAIRGQLNGAVLPLKLTYFNGYKQANKIELVWETSAEVNVSHYEIEQFNITNNTWITKGTVLPQGGSSATKYTFEDVPNLYSNQYVMYRLKMIDKDGRITYSSLIKLNYETLKAELFIQTNPIVNGTLRYTITGLSAGKKAEISIVDFNGKTVLRHTVSSLINNTLEIPRLSAGVYKLVVRVDDTILQKNFIK